MKDIDIVPINTRELNNLSEAIVLGYIRQWRDIDNDLHYELTERGIVKLANLMVK